MEHYRRIVHVDLDAFYVSAELLRHAELRGKPLAVGGRPESRGVVCASSYEARAFGVRSGAPCRKALELCPQLTILPPDFPYYRALSDQVGQVFAAYTDVVEPYACDEAYLDLTAHSRAGEAKETAQKICQDIYRTTGLSASAGVSYNKFVAKLASAYQKPRGLTTVSPSRAVEFIGRHKVQALHGIGRVRAARLQQRGLCWAHELQQRSQAELLQWFGSYGHFLYWALQGIDERPVLAQDTQKSPQSLGAERTFARDLLLQELGQPNWQQCFGAAETFFAAHQHTLQEQRALRNWDTSRLPNLEGIPPQSLAISFWLYELCGAVCAMLQGRHLAAEALTVKVRTAEFQSHSRTISWLGRENTSLPLLQKAALATDALAAKLAGLGLSGQGRKIRLLGVTSRNLHRDKEPDDPFTLLR